MEKKEKTLLYCLSNPFKTPGWLKLDKGEQNGRCEVKQIAVRLNDILKATPPPPTHTSSGSPARCITIYNTFFPC